jgi:hypothetical protein
LSSHPLDQGNSIYNIIPYTLSNLSVPTTKWRLNNVDPEGLHPDSLKNIMKYLFGFIEKEQHVESLVSKLCLRYAMGGMENVCFVFLFF